MNRLLSYSFLSTLLLGQALAIILSLCNLLVALLARMQVSLPATVALGTYLLLATTAGGMVVYRMGVSQGFRSVVIDGWQVFLPLAIFDCAGSYLVVRSFSYTSMLSAMLLDSWAVPCCAIVSRIFLKSLLRWQQWTGIALCVAGIGVLVLADASLTAAGPNPLLGDLLCVIGATLYALSNVLMESRIRHQSRVEVLAGLGLFGSVLALIPLTVFETAAIQELFEQAAQQTVRQNAEMGLLLAGLVLGTFTFYSLAPVLFRMASATFFNLSLLASDVYGLVFGVFIFGSSISLWFPLSYLLIIAGILLYNIYQSKSTDQQARAFGSMSTLSDPSAHKPSPPLSPPVDPVDLDVEADPPIGFIGWLCGRHERTARSRPRQDSFVSGRDVAAV